jgi:uncharacterized protein YndB with AHSA1/START domain
MTGWQADTAHGETVIGQRITLGWPSLRLNVKLEVKELVPHERIVLGVGASQLTIELAPGEVRLTHDGLRSEDEAAGMRSAWRTSLGLLAHGLAKHGGRERQVRWITRLARTSPAVGHLFFTQPAALAQWLTRSGEIGPESSEVELRLLSGETLTGEVLANTEDRDVAFTWREQDESCLVLRSFPSPSDPEERLLALSWSKWSAGSFPDSTVRHIEHSFDRLIRTLNNRGSA